jgi:hypothetical protein
MVPRDHPISVGPAVNCRPGIVWHAESVGYQYGNSVAVVVPGPQTCPINGCDQSVAQRPPSLMVCQRAALPWTENMRATIDERRRRSPLKRVSCRPVRRTSPRIGMTAETFSPRLSAPQNAWAIHLGPGRSVQVCNEQSLLRSGPVPGARVQLRQGAGRVERGPRHGPCQRRLPTHREPRACPEPTS